MEREETIKIARVIARLNVGGPAIHAALLSAAFNSGEFTTTLICGSLGRGEGDMGYYAAGLGVEPVYLRSLGREIGLLSDLRVLWRLYSIFKAERPHIVHTHTAKAGAIGRLAAVAAGVPVRVHTFHGHVFHGYFGAFKSGLFIAAERFLARFTDRVIVLSENMRREICHLYKVAPEGKVSVVPLGLDLEPFLKSSGDGAGVRRRLRIPPEAFTVGIVGRLVEVKDHELFLRAAKNLIDQSSAGGDGREGPRFIIVGDGHLRGELEALAEELSLGDRVVFTGWRRDLADLYSALDVVALTSKNEGTPVSLIEAMAAARPVVATDVGGVKDLFEPASEDSPPGEAARAPGLRLMANGVLIEGRDESTFAEALSLLMDDPGLGRAMGARGREFVRRRYSASRLVEELRELYLGLLKEKSHGSSPARKGGGSRR